MELFFAWINDTLMHPAEWDKRDFNAWLQEEHNIPLADQESLAIGRMEEGHIFLYSGINGDPVSFSDMPVDALSRMTRLYRARFKEDTCVVYNGMDFEESVPINEILVMTFEARSCTSCARRGYLTMSDVAACNCCEDHEFYKSMEE